MNKGREKERTEGKGWIWQQKYIYIDKNLKKGSKIFFLKKIKIIPDLLLVR